MEKYTCPSDFEQATQETLQRLWGLNHNDFHGAFSPFSIKTCSLFFILCAALCPVTKKPRTQICVRGFGVLFFFSLPILNAFGLLIKRSIALMAAGLYLSL